MSIRPVTFFLTSFAFLFSFQFAQAQTQIADVNVTGAAIASQEGNTLTINFSIANGKGVQSGVRYGVQLLEKGGMKVVDQKVYEETIKLDENSVTPKTVSYTIPDTLSGTYLVYVGVNNDKGFPLGFSSVGEVTTTATVTGIAIVPGSCSLKLVSGQSFPVTQGVTIAPTDQLVVSCTIVNNGATSAVVTPSFETRELSAYGDVVSVPGKTLASPTILAKEKKVVNVPVPVAEKPKLYFASLSFTSGDMKSNAVELRYTITGPTASIMNIALDKDYYKKGETAVAMVTWTGGTAQTKAEVEIGAKGGFTCGKVISQAISQGTSKISVPMKRNCANPQVTVSITDEKAGVLDTATTEFTTTSVEAGMYPMAKVGLILLGVVILIGLASYIKKRGMPHGTTVAVLVFALFVLLPFTKTHAYTYTIGSQGNIFVTVNIDNQTTQGAGTNFRPGELISVSGSIINSSSVPQKVSLKAITIGNNEVELFSSQGVTIPAGGTITAQPKSLTVSRTLTDTLPKTYPVTFTAGVDETISQIYVKVTTLSVASGYNTDQSCRVENGMRGTVQFYWERPMMRAAFYRDVAATIPFDATGSGLILAVENAGTTSSYGWTYNPSIPWYMPYSGGTIGTVGPLSGTYWDFEGPGYNISYTDQYGSSSCDIQYNPTGLAILNAPTAPVPYVIIPPPPAGLYIGASPSTVTKSTSGTVQPTMITWGSQHATSCVGTNFNTGGAVEGSVSVTPPANVSSINYTITCTNMSGTANETTTVTVYQEVAAPTYCDPTASGFVEICTARQQCLPDIINPGYVTCR